MAVRGIRGATTITENSEEEILKKTGEMLEELVKVNEINVDDIASALFSVTAGIDKVFPAVAARQLGWIYTPLMCTNEIPIEGSLQNCIRVLLHVNSEKEQKKMRHVYLYDAKKLRPDINTEKQDEFYLS